MKHAGLPPAAVLMPRHMCRGRSCRRAGKPMGNKSVEETEALCGWAASAKGPRFLPRLLPKSFFAAACAAQKPKNFWGGLIKIRGLFCENVRSDILQNRKKPTAQGKIALI